MSRLLKSFHPWAWITIFFWSLAYIFTRLALQHFSAFSLGFLRYAAASAALVVVALCMKLRMPPLREIPLYLAAGATGFFLYMLAFNTGALTVTSSTSSVIIATVPVMTAMLAGFFYGEKLKKLQWLAIALEFVGILILTLINGVFMMNSGVFLIFLAAVFLCTYNLLQRKITRTSSALQASAWSIFFGTLMLAIFLPRSIEEVRQAAPVYLIYVVVLGVFCSALAYVAWSEAFARAERTSQVSNYMFVTPVLTGFLEFLVIGEAPDLPTVAGGAVILLGAWAFNRLGRQEQPAATPKTQEASQ